MRTITPALKAHLAQGFQTMCSCWQVTLKPGTPLEQVIGFTDHDRDIVIAGWTAPNDVFNGTYQAVAGYTASANTSSNQMDVDQLSVTGPQRAPAITEADLHAGLWDFAEISLFQVNWADLSMGPLIERTGWTGQMSTGRFDFTSELRGMMQAYARSLGRLYVPACDANLGDARCTVDLTPFTVSSTLTGVNPNGFTLYDSTLTQPGPTGGVDITGVTNANPGVVTLADASSFANGQVVTLSGIVGPALLNATTIIRNINVGANTFELGIDTSDTSIYPAYVSGGTVTPLGDTSGYFDFGVITMTSGVNSGLSMEVKSYVPGQVTLLLPFGFGPCSIGDSYTMHAGCDKLPATCKDRFNNLVNYRGFPFLPGNDALVQVGRSQ